MYFLESESHRPTPICADVGIVHGEFREEAVRAVGKMQERDSLLCGGSQEAPCPLSALPSQSLRSAGDHQ